jgi:hypothetical protein
MDRSSPLTEVVKTSGQSQDLVLLVDIANLTGSHLNGWWRDGGIRSSPPAQRVEPLNGAEVTLPAALGTGGKRPARGG